MTKREIFVELLEDYYAELEEFWKERASSVEAEQPQDRGRFARRAQEHLEKLPQEKAERLRRYDEAKQ